nr:MAG TPA: hypothetical protein [Caudoviricetes sp.]
MTAYALYPCRPNTDLQGLRDMLLSTSTRY